MRNLRVAVLILSFLCSALPGLGQGATQYFYDANGRLSGVIAPNGEAAIYRYDAAGNVSSIEHIGAGQFAVLSFSPQVGTIGDPVTFVGVGLDTVSSVSFNGTPAQIISATPNSLVSAVPDGASTGFITLSGVRGSFTTTTAFAVVARVVITPSLAEMLPSESVQFQANVVGTPDQRVTWAVNGITGGSSTVGTITNTGVYFAPDINTGLTVTITATSQADTSVVGQAAARVLNPNTTSEIQSPLVVVSVGLASATQISALPVSVAHNANINDFILAPPVAVGKGELLNLVAATVSVQAGAPQGISGPSVSVDFADSRAVSSPPVSATNGPVLAQISPATLLRGANSSVTVTGQNLGGTTGVFFVLPNGGLERNITVTNISVSPDGTTLTFTAAVSTSAATGNDVVYVLAANGRSATTSTGSNTVQIH